MDIMYCGSLKHNIALLTEEIQVNPPERYQPESRLAHHRQLVDPINHKNGSVPPVLFQYHH